MGKCYTIACRHRQGRAFNPIGYVFRNRYVRTLKDLKHNVKSIPSRYSSDGRLIKVSSDFFAAVVTGGILGFCIDRVFSISPWGLVIFLLLGFASGVLDILRYANPLSVDTIKEDGGS